jgi:hypothetical protein
MSVIGGPGPDEESPEKKTNHEEVMENAAIRGLLLLEDILKMQHEQKRTLDKINFNMGNRGFKP